jgi:branched-chain amino acid aminotransferase
VERDGVESSAIDKYRWRKSKMKSFYKGVISESDNVLPIDSSLLRGDGVFETILSIDQVAIAWDRHFARLEKAAEKVLITTPPKIDIELAIEKILKDEIGRNRLRVVCLGDGGWFLTLQPVAEISESASLTKFPYTKNSKSLTAGIKSLSYTDSITALRYAESLGFDDAIFINERDEVVETGLANLILLTDQGWITPHTSTGCLPGIMRELLIYWFGVKEAVITYEDLLKAQCVYTSSSIRLMQRIEKIDQKLFSRNEKGDALLESLDLKLMGNLNP